MIGLKIPKGGRQISWSSPMQFCRRSYLPHSIPFSSGQRSVLGEMGQNRLQTHQVSSDGPSLSKSAKLFNVCSNL